MFPSKRYKWNAMDIGPKKDVVAVLAHSVRQLGLKFGVHYTFMEWFNNIYISDLKLQEKSTLYTDAIVMPDLKYLVNTYKPSVLWVNGDQYARCDYWKSQEFLVWLYYESPVKNEIVVNDRWSACARGQHGDFYSCHNYGMRTIKTSHTLTAVTNVDFLQRFSPVALEIQSKIVYLYSLAISVWKQRVVMTTPIDG